MHPWSETKKLGAAVVPGRLSAAALSLGKSRADSTPPGFAELWPDDELTEIILSQKSGSRQFNSRVSQNSETFLMRVYASARNFGTTSVQLSERKDGLQFPKRHQTKHLEFVLS